MSRIGRMPIAIPAGVTVEIAENNKLKEDEVITWTYKNTYS